MLHPTSFARNSIVVVQNLDMAVLIKVAYHSDHERIEDVPKDFNVLSGMG